MKFKHTFHVFVDNFNCTYKLLLYRFIVSAISFCLYTAVIFSFLQLIMDTTQIEQLNAALEEFSTAFVNLDFNAMQLGWENIRAAAEQIVTLLTTRLGEIIGGITVLAALYLVQHFFLGLGNYTLGAMVNDRMALHANSPFFGTLVKNLGKAALYNAIYVPLSFVYDVLSIILVWAIFFVALPFLPLLVKIFLFATVFLFLTAIKMTFTTDWLPSLINGKTNNRTAIAASFRSKGRRLDVLSNYLVLVLTIFGLNFAACVFTFGAGMFITLPASYVVLIAFEFVNYCDANNIKYFTDKNTVVKPEKEQSVTREQFFKGDE